MYQLSRDIPQGCLSDLLFDEWAAAELDSAQVREFAAHVAGCARCRAHKLGLERDRQAFFEDPPVKLPSIAPGLPVRWRQRKKAVVLSSGLSMLAVAALALLIRAPDTEVSTRSKGRPALGFFVNHGERVSRGHNGQAVYPGDVLRFAVSTNGTQFGAVLSLDGSGSASVYFPDGALSVKVPAGAMVPLDSAVKLDGVLGHERLFGVFCPSAFAIEPLRARLATEKRLPAPDGCTVSQIDLRKVAAP